MHTLTLLSDLHLGGAAPEMMSTPQALADFIDDLKAPEGDRQELVINGDFIDFLAIPVREGEQGTAWTPDPQEACAKLHATLRGQPRAVFDALGRFLQRGQLTVLLGNHDVELGLPQVQDALIRHLGGDAHRVRFIDDGRAYRCGGLLVEHGNRYDDANLNDWDGLRRIASCLSRDEAHSYELKVSAGSQLVQRCVNPLKAAYPFLDLIQPQNVGVALLLMEFEPKLRRHIGQIARMLHGAFLQWTAERRQGEAPPRGRNVSAQGDDTFSALPPRVEETFAQELRQLRAPGQNISAADWGETPFRPTQDGLSALIDATLPIPRARLKRLQTLFAEYLPEGAHLSPDGDPGVCGQAAERVLRESDGIELVVMGHTHQMRRVGPPDKARYINTGTWADLITTPPSALVDSDEGLDALRDFLIDLRHDRRVRQQRPSWAEVRLNGEGRVQRAALVQGPLGS